MTKDTKVKPKPPVKRKDEIIDKEVFSKLDEFSFRVPTDFHKHPLKVLVGLLMMRHKQEKELVKVRLLFRWIVAQNLKAVPANDQEDSVGKRFEMIRNETDTYAGLFEDMCKHADIQCHTVTGIVKAGTYTVGDEIDFKNSPRNQWSAVHMDGEWRLLDIQFAAHGKVINADSNEEDKDWALVDDSGAMMKNKTDKDAKDARQSVIEEFYFLTDPEEFVYNHFPDEEKWQLLSKPINQLKFQDLPYLRSNFFKLGFQLDNSSQQGTLYANSGEVQVTFRNPGKRDRRFLHQFFMKPSDKPKNFDVKKMSQCVFLEQSENKMTCKVYLPYKGKYKLDLYSRDSSFDGTEQEIKSFACIAEFLIICTQEKANWNAVPVNHRKEWGPGKDTEKFGLVAISHTQGLIECDGGWAEIKFKINKPVKLNVKLSRDDKPEVDCTRWTLHRTENKQAVIYVKVLRSGMYALNIFAMADDDRTTGQSMMLDNYHHVCAYRVKCSKSAADKMPLPDMIDQKTGSTKDSETFGIAPYSHHDSVFETDQSTLTIIMKNSPSIQFIPKLILSDPVTTKPKLIPNSVFYHPKPDRTTFSIRFPYPGMYHFQIHTQWQNSTDEFPRVFNYVITVKDSDQLRGYKPYPKVYPRWQEGCEVEGLMDGVVPTEEDVTVRVRAPQAVELALVEGRLPWAYLDKTSDGSWTKTITTGTTADTTLKLAAAFTHNADDFSTLLEYQIKSRKELGLMARDQIEKAKEMAKRKAEEEKQRLKMEKEYERLKIALEEAVKERDITKLRKVLQQIENQGLIGRFKGKYTEAKNLLDKLERLERLRSPIMDMNAKTMAEIKSYGSPPQVVHDVMRAALLLLGSDEGVTSNWKQCQALCNTNDLRKRVRKFNIEKCKPEVALRAERMIKDLNLEKIRDTSAGAACFYIWVLGIVEEMGQMHDMTSLRPASVQRQRTLLKTK